MDRQLIAKINSQITEIFTQNDISHSDAIKFIASLLTALFKENNSSIDEFIKFTDSMIRVYKKQ